MSLMTNKCRTRTNDQPTTQLVELSIRNNVLDVIQKHRNIAQARQMSVFEVSRSLQSRVSTTHRTYSQMTFFILYMKKHVHSSRSTWHSYIRYQTYLVGIF